MLHLLARPEDAWWTQDEAATSATAIATAEERSYGLTVREARWGHPLGPRLLRLEIARIGKDIKHLPGSAAALRTDVRRLADATATYGFASARYEVVQLLRTELAKYPPSRRSASKQAEQAAALADAIRLFGEEP